MPRIPGADPPYWWEYIDQGEGYTPDPTGLVVAPSEEDLAMIVASDLILYSPANRPADDVSVAGGAIAPLVRPVFSLLTAADDLEAVSTSPADVGVLSVTGRNQAGVVTTVNMTLNGTTTVTDSTILTRILAVSYATPANGTIRLRRRAAGPVVCSIPAGEQAVSALFKGSVGGPSAVRRYDKVFFKNVHSTLTLSAAVVQLTADPSAKIRIGVATTIDDTVTLPNRLIEPGGVVFQGAGVAISVPGNVIPPGSAIGVWVEETLGLDSSLSSYFKVSVMGAS